jgi:hypothetical protein
MTWKLERNQKTNHAFVHAVTVEHAMQWFSSKSRRQKALPNGDLHDVAKNLFSLLA